MLTRTSKTYSNNFRFVPIPDYTFRSNNLNHFKSHLRKINFNKSQLKSVPTKPGIYIFWDKDERPHYVGKSISLKNRLRSYLSLPLDIKTSEMIANTVLFSYIRVSSELESLLLEAKLIKLFQSKYNIVLKDDKNPIYIKITADKYPQILTARKLDERKFSYFYGPFPSSNTVRSVLKMIRKAIPFSQHLPGNKPCFYSQLGLCNPCPSQIENEKDQIIKKSLIYSYRKNITNIKNLLDGKIVSVHKDLKTSMDRMSKKEDYEKAANFRNKIKYFEYISQSIIRPSEFLKNPNLLLDIRTSEYKELYLLLSKYFKITSLKRIECYDIAHLSGSHAAASMVTFIDGESDKKLYRRFKIKQNKGDDDLSSLREVAIRREKHLIDWGKPDLMVIDGGKGQVNAFLRFIIEHNIPVVGLAKRNEIIIIPLPPYNNNFIEFRLKLGHLLNLFQRVRNEAHRFARVYHHKLIDKEFAVNI